MAVQLSEKEIERLVEEVVRRVRGSESPSLHPMPAGREDAPGVFPEVGQAVEAAEEAWHQFRSVPLERRKVFIAAMRGAAERLAEELAREAVRETGLGKPAHKVQKNLLAARKTPGTEDLAPLCYTGDDGLTLVEPAPFGVVAAITPCTNPVATVINNSISLVTAGNAVVFNPHPSAKRVSNRMVVELNRAIHSLGGPRNLLCTLAEPGLETSQALMKHAKVRLLLVTGGGAVMKLALSSGKKTVAAGPGNPPVIVDDTADIERAARCIVDGASFDNNVLCIAEKEVFVFDNVANRLVEEMQKQGAYLASEKETEMLAALLVEPGEPFPHPNRKFVGKDAAVLLEQIGVRPASPARLIICRTRFEHPFVQAEMLMPVLPIVAVRDLDEALEKAKAAEHGFRHTAIMHSESISRLSRVALEIETTIFVKNGPSYAGLGFGGEGFATLSIAGPTGEGLTSARTFTRQRRCVLTGGFRII